MERMFPTSRVTAAAVAALLLGCAPQRSGTEALEEKVRALEQRVAALEQQLAAREPQRPSEDVQQQLYEQEVRELGGARPSAIASTGQAVTAETPLRVGQVVQVEWQATWWAAKVIGLSPDGTVRIHYLGWESSYDEAVSRSRVQLDPEAWTKARKALSAPE